MGENRIFYVKDVLDIEDEERITQDNVKDNRKYDIMTIQHGEPWMKLGVTGLVAKNFIKDFSDRDFYIQDAWDDAKWIERSAQLGGNR